MSLGVQYEHDTSTAAPTEDMFLLILPLIPNLLIFSMIAETEWRLC